jgi:thiol-disulfide isomerase/thioredoxin
VQQDYPQDPLTTQVPIQPPQRSSLRLAAVLFLIAASFLYVRSHVFRAPKHLNVASLDMRKLSGESLAPAAFQGKAVVLNFWAPWCGPCRSEIPALQQLQAEHSNNLVVIGVDNDPETYVEAALFANMRGVTYPLVRKNAAMINTIGAMETIPTTLYIDASGTVVHTTVGAMSEARMEAYARDALRH